MWLRLDDHEAAFLAELLNRELKEQLHVDDEGKGKLQTIFDRLNEPPDSDTAAFAAAVDTNDELEVDSDTVISRSDDGAFVMAWVYVTNAEAGVEPEEDASCENCGGTDNDGSDICTDCGGAITS
ncbi:hypothetical protein IB276_33240 [Ensifer sp. ENS04]|uniref:hypothetical protein n=1 Tax=Ensifer sp. ENS04 TaxID=2769281 RepID=UPI001784A8D7|nr:hypothetical protein [Ensifer sp. ENS04]MBD9544313.1 hypothetical protein [Ensifer sp. ENS04]